MIDKNLNISIFESCSAFSLDLRIVVHPSIHSSIPYVYSCEADPPIPVN